MKIALAQSLSVVHFSEDGVRAKRHLNCNIFVEETPFPGGIVLIPKETFQPCFHFLPSNFHHIGIILIAPVSLMNMIIKSLVRWEQAKVADIVMRQRFDDFPKFGEENFIEGGLV